MRAVIMAAGMGRRMNNSIEMPKSILPVGETTIIRHTVKMLTDNGISTAVVVGYRKNDIYSALQGLPVTYYFNPFFKVTNSMASLWFAKEFLSSKDDIILCNADVFWQEDILNEVLKDDHRIVMLGDKTRGSVGDYCFELTEDSFINSFGKNLEDGKKHTEYVGPPPMPYGRRSGSYAPMPSRPPPAQVPPFTQRPSLSQTAKAVRHWPCSAHARTYYKKKKRRNP